jgi:fructokinase
MANTPLLTVIGEALIDLVPTETALEYHARAGGSPFNVAIGLARLGARAQLMARLGDDAFGRILRQRAAAEGVDLSLAPLAAEPATLAVLSFDAEAKANYDFYLNGAANWQWTADELGRLGRETAAIHFGSLASWTPPGADRILNLITQRRKHSQTLISYDPNVRPSLLRDPEHARPLIEESLKSAHIVKASRDDLAWLYSEQSIEQVAKRWVGLGPLVVIITDGADGAHAFHERLNAIHISGCPTEVVDTVGAGDAFTAGFLNALTRRGHLSRQALATLSPDALAACIDEANLIASLTCRRVGADPPTLLERQDRHPDAALTPGDFGFPE